MSATSGGPDGTATTQNAGQRLGLKNGMVIQELGWDASVTAEGPFYWGSAHRI